MKPAIAIGIGGTTFVLAGYLLFWPVPIEPVAWTPPAAPELEGRYVRNDALAVVERLPTGGTGPEDVAVDERGRVYAGVDDGRIMRMRRDGSGLEPFADTGGRPLGLHFDRMGNLIVADARRGLLSVTPAGEIEVLATEHDGVPFRFTDDVDIGADGTIYVSDASSRWTYDQVFEAALEHRPHGRLLAYDPSAGSTKLLLDDLYFANGVAVSDDDDYVLVNETTAYRVRRYWLRGPRAGQAEVLIDNLPGLPDGISRGKGGRYWIAIYSPRVSALDAMLPHPRVRKIVYRLPRLLQPAPARHAMILAIDEDGDVVANLQDASSDSYAPITSVQEHEGYLYLGSLEREHIARLPLPTR